MYKSKNIMLINKLLYTFFFKFQLLVLDIIWLHFNFLFLFYYTFMKIINRIHKIIYNFKGFYKNLNIS